MTGFGLSFLVFVVISVIFFASGGDTINKVIGGISAYCAFVTALLALLRFNRD